MRGHWFIWLVLLALGLLLWSHAQSQTATTVSVRPYYVTNAATFPSLALPAKPLVFRNGVFQMPGVDYDVINGTALVFRAGVLMDGDRVGVVSLP